MKFRPDYRLLGRYFHSNMIGAIPQTNIREIHPVRLKELLQHIDAIRDLLESKSYNISLDHLDNFCLISEFITRFPDRFLNESQDEHRKKLTQEKYLLEAIENDKLISVRFEFLKGLPVTITQKWLVSKIKDFISKDFSDSSPDGLKLFNPQKKRRKAQRHWEKRIAKSLFKFLTDENLISVKNLAYHFICEFFAALDRPLKYSEGEKSGQEVPPKECSEYVRQLTR